MKRSLALGLLLLLFLFAGSLAPASAQQPQSTTTWTGEYYNNTDLSGAPAFVREDANINFFWPEYTSPIPGVVNVDHYSIRWTRGIYANVAGNWTFNIVSDDGMRVWVDNNILIDSWVDQGPTARSATLFLNVGWHTAKVEYYNRTLGGTARVSYGLGSGGTFSQWKGEYFNNQDLSGSPVITRNDVAISFNWGLSAPDPAVPPDHFSVRWTRTIPLAAGNWRFTTTTDDGVRLWVDNSLVIDKWVDQPATTWTGDIALGAGNHAIRMEYFDSGGNAVAQMSYAPVSAPPPPPGPFAVWRGQYFNNMFLAGSPAFVRNDQAINFNWGTGSPAPGIPPDQFSVRWDSVRNVAVADNYTFTVTVDDGVRVWVDNSLVIDQWSDHAPTTFSGSRYLAAGLHAIRVEYYENMGGAQIAFQVQTGNPLPPGPTGDIIVDDLGPGYQAGGKSTSWRSVGTGYGGRAFWTFNDTYTVPNYNWARWYPTLPGPRNYEVSAFIPAGIATTTNARYWIAHAGSYNLAARAQAFFPNQWVSLGTYYFAATGNEYVSLSDVTYECYLCRVVVFDAIKFSPR